MEIKGIAIIDKNGKVYMGDTEVFNLVTSSLEDLYHHLKIDYPKFYKMDSLSQLGFLLSEMVMSNEKIPTPTSIIVWNRHSSLEADLKHQDNIKNGISGPAVFTYTLPNIMVGEIAIRNQIKGETTLLVADQIHATDFLQTHLSINENSDSWCLTGWLDATPTVKIGFLCLLKPGKALNHDVEIKINDIFTKII